MEAETEGKGMEARRLTWRNGWPNVRLLLKRMNRGNVIFRPVVFRGERAISEKSFRMNC